MARSKKSVLYFTPGSSITDEQAEEMERIPGARQRNAGLIDLEAPMEKCDGVAGPAIPANYREAYPIAEALAPADPDDEPVEGVEDMTVAELKAELKERGVDYPSDAKKADLVALYQQNVQE